MVRSNHDTELSSNNLTGSQADQPNASAHLEQSLDKDSGTTPSRRPLSGMARSMMWFFALLLTGSASAILGAALMIFAPVPSVSDAEPAEDKSLQAVLQNALGYRITRPINILVMGVDRVMDGDADADSVFEGRSDTLLLVRLDPIEETASILSIPRDTQVRVPGLGITKVNHANAYGGAELAAETVMRNFEGVPIDRYIRVDTDAFRELVDLVGGVEVFVPTRMEYTDETQGLYIDLEPGLQVLDGDQAEQFARFRQGGNGDIGRVQRQQQLLRALREQITRPATLPKVPQAIELIQQHIDTNMSFEELLAIASFGLQLDRDNLRMVMLPGRFSTPQESIASYWILDPESRTRLMRDYFDVVPTDVFMEVNDVDLNRLRIAIQNGTDTPDLSRQVARYLREQGFRNVYVIQDSPEALAETQVISQRGDLDSAQRLQALLQVGEVIPASTGDIGSDLTIRLGQDWTMPGVQ